MNAERPLRLTIEVEGSDPLTGRIGEEESEMTPFAGWLGLAAHLDELVATRGGPTKEPEEPQAPSN